MQHYILPPFAEPSEPVELISPFDSHRAVSQPELPMQDTPYRLFASSQTFTERQNETTEIVREYGNKEAFGELVFERQNTEGGMSWQAGTARRNKR